MLDFPRLRIHAPANLPIGDGLTIAMDDKPLTTVTAVRLDAKVGELTEVTLTFYAEVDADLPALLKRATCARCERHADESTTVDVQLDGAQVMRAIAPRAC